MMVFPGACGRTGGPLLGSRADLQDGGPLSGVGQVAVQEAVQTARPQQRTIQQVRPGCGSQHHHPCIPKLQASAC